MYVARVFVEGVQSAVSGEGANERTALFDLAKNLAQHLRASEAQLHRTIGTAVPDVTDHHVLSMADSNHRPVETWSFMGELQSVHCQTCGNTWPCPTRLAIRALNGRST